MSAIVAAENDNRQSRISKKFVLTLPSVSSRIIAQSDSLTKYEASTKHRISASATTKSSSSTGSSLVDSNNNCCQSTSLEKPAEDGNCNRQHPKKKKSSSKKKKSKNPNSRRGSEINRDDPTVTSLTVQSLPLENGDRDNTQKSTDETSSIESDIEPSRPAKSSSSEVPLRSVSLHQRSEEVDNQSQSVGFSLNDHRSSEATSFDEDLEPSGDWNLLNDYSQMQPTVIERMHRELDTVGNKTIASERRSSVLEDLPSATVPPVPIPSVSVPSASIPSISVSSVFIPSVPDPSVPDPSVPDPSVPDPSVPDSSVPYPSVLEPSTPVPSIPVPSIPVPSIPVPSVPVPSVPVPSIPVPSVPVPPVPVPSVPVPSIPVPSIPVPSIPVPSIPVPSIPVPSIPVPSVSVPSVSVPSFVGLEKSRKDLQRQSVLLHRLTPILKERMEKSIDSISVTFQELRNRLNRREIELISDLNTVTSQANAVLSEQKMKGEQLKCEIQQLLQPTDSDIAQLKSQIKEYVSKRKVYEDMSERHRFLFDWTNILEEIGKFGEIAPLEASVNQFPVTPIPRNSGSTESTVAPVETTTPANAPTTTTDDNDEAKSPNNLIEDWWLAVEKSVAINEVSDSTESARLDLCKGDNVRPDSVDNVNSTHSTISPLPSAKRICYSNAEINIVTEQRNRTDTDNFDLRPRACHFKDIISPMNTISPRNTNSPTDVNSPKDMNSPKDTNLPKDTNSPKDVNPPKDVNSSKDMNSSKDANLPMDVGNYSPPLNGVHWGQAKSNDKKSESPTFSGQKKLPSNRHPTHQPLEQTTAGNDDQVRFKSENDAQEKRRHPQKRSNPSDATNDGIRPLIGSLSNEPAERKWRSLSKHLQISDADNALVKEEPCEAVLSRSTEPDESTEEKENVGKKKRKKRKSKRSKGKMDDTIQDDSSSSVSDSSKDSAVTVHQKEGKQQTHAKVTVQNKPNSADIDSVSVKTKRGSTVKRKKSRTTKHSDDENSLILAKSILSKSIDEITTTSEQQNTAYEAIDDRLQKQNCAVKTGETIDKSVVNRCREYGEKKSNVAEANIDRNSRNETNADDKCKRKNIGVKLIKSLQKHDRQNSEATRRSECEPKNIEVKVNKRSSQNQNGCPFQAQEALSARFNLISSKDQQRI